MSETIKKSIGEGFGKADLYAALAYNTSDKFGGMKIKGLGFSPVAGKPAINVGDSTTAWTALYGDRAISIYSTCADTGNGNAMPVYISATMSGTGGLGRALEAVLNVTGKLGSYGNALKGYINLTTGTGTSGLASAVCAEMKMPAGTALGTFGVLEIELVAPASGWTAGQGTGTNCISWIYAQVSGTKMTEFNEYGYLFNLQGLTSSTTDLLYNNTLKCAIGSTKWYLPLSSAEGSYTSAYPIALNYSGVALALTGGAKATITSTGDYTSPPFVVTRTFVTADFDQTYHAAARVNLDLTNDVPAAKYASALNIRIIGAGDVAATGQLYGLWVDSAGTAAAIGGTFHMARFSVQAGAAIPTSYLQFQTADPGVTYAFAFVNNNAIPPCTAGGTDCTASGATDPTYTIAVQTPDGNPGYIRVFAAA